MKIKKLSQYTDEEMKELLMFWFNYYGKKVYNFDELSKFKTIVDSQTKTMFGTAALLYKRGLGPTVVLDAIRGDMKTIEETVKELNTISSVELLDASTAFIREVVTSYNAPEKSTMTQEETLSQILKMFGIDASDVDIIEYSAGEPTLSDRIEEIAKYVLYKDDEIVYGMPNKNFVIEQCNNNSFAFCAERLEKKIKDIESIAKEIKISDKPTTLNDLSLQKDNKKWTKNMKDVEFLVALLLACGIIKKIDTKDGNIGYVKTNNVKKKIVGKKPSEFPCVKGLLQHKMKKELTFDEIVGSISEIITKEASKILSLLGFELIIEECVPSFTRLTDRKKYKAQVELNHEKISFKAEIDDKIIEYTLELKEGKNKGDLLTTENILTMPLNDNELNYGECISVQLGNHALNPSKICTTHITYVNTNLDNKVYEYVINDNQLYAEISSDLSLEDTNDKKRRTVFFTDPISDKVCSHPLIVLESSKDDELNISLDREEQDIFSLNIDSKSNKVRKIIDVMSGDEAKTIAVNYLRTTRVKNTCNHILNVLESAIPNIKDYFKDTHEFYNYLSELMQEAPDSSYEDEINKYSIKELNLPNEGKGGKRRKRNGK